MKDFVIDVVDACRDSDKLGVLHEFVMSAVRDHC
jgi:hypothetical protein